MTPIEKQAVYFAATLLAVCFSLGVPGYKKRIAALLSVGVLANLCFTFWVYSQRPPQIMILELTGVKPSFHELLAFNDAILGLVAVCAMIATRFWWLPIAILGVVITQLFLHALFERGWPYAAYESWMDATYWGYLAALFIAGYNGTLQAIGGGIERLKRRPGWRLVTLQFSPARRSSSGRQPESHRSER